jgi:inorganic triphosphatase YgiF
MRLQDNLEVEYKFSVTGDDPDAFLDEVARLPTLGGMRLGPPIDHRLHDIYWDVADGELRASKLSLRLRSIDDQLVFTVKGGSTSTDGLFSRHELEVPATAENWPEVRTVLAGEGASLGPDVSGREPADWLRAAGLHPTQERVTRRTVRYAFADDTDSHPLAELALDRTRFDFGKALVDYWEIEIEQLAGGETATGELGRALMARYPDRLEPSTMGKYSRGLTIERELRLTGQL